MGVPATLREAYSRWETHIESLGKYITNTIQVFADQHQFPFLKRKKDLDSLSEKLESGRFAKWSEIDDLFACTVVVPSVNYEDDVIAFLDGVFQRVELRKRDWVWKPPEVFRFDTTRWYGIVGKDSHAPITDSAKTLRFEVQVPSYFDMAWSVATRDLAYKSDTIDWRRLRLAAAMKASVEQLDLLVATFSDVTDAVLTSRHPPTNARRIIVEELNALVQEGLIPVDLIPQSWSRIADNVIALVKSAGDDRAATTASDLVRSFAEQLRQGTIQPVPHSGSLMQVLIGFFVAERDADALNAFPVVESPELSVLHGVTEIPLAFEFDG